MLKLLIKMVIMLFNLASIETDKDISNINKPQRKIFSSINIKPKKIIKRI